MHSLSPYKDELEGPPYANWVVHEDRSWLLNVDSGYTVEILSMIHTEAADTSPKYTREPADPLSAYPLGHNLAMGRSPGLCDIRRRRGGARTADATHIGLTALAPHCPNI